MLSVGGKGPKGELLMFRAVIPSNAGVQFKNTGFRVKPGMTIKVKRLLTEYWLR
jgi:hypothetical protein